MTIPDRTKGYLFAFLATLAMSNVYIFSKAALAQVHLVQFGFFWFGMAVSWNLIYALPTGKHRLLRKLPARCFGSLLLIGLLEIAGTTAFFAAIQTVENPAIVSFLANLTPLFVTLLGVSFLRDRFTRIEAAGIVLTFIGAFVISYQGGNSLGDFFIRGSGLVLISSFFFSLALVLAKSKIGKIDPGILSLNRAFFLFLFSAIMLASTHHSLSVPRNALLNMAAGSLLGPFLTAFSQYNALRFIEASRASIIQSSRSLFVLLGALLYFGILPMAYQLAGGLLTITGVVLITTGRLLGRKNRNPLPRV